MSADEHLAAAFRRAFLGDDGRPHIDGQAMLDDLAAACGAFRSTQAFDSTGRLDTARMAQLEGRRQVWLHLQRRIFGPARTGPPATVAAFDDLN